MVIAVPSKHLAVLALNQKHRNITRDNLNMTNIAPTNAGVNVLLGGAMMSCMLIMVVCICYLCHWRFQKVEERFERNNSWMQVTDSDTPIHIFTLNQQRYDVSGLYQDSDDYDQPPPDYDLVMSMEKNECSEENDPELPSYETALKLSGQGYV
ncbi:uncharacterized protein s-cup [Halyomorpha halys]|uniref:uncharacterized protein s-cup n=1 Tax=Halyomorpha halys TaxID=286706 RepID=UPI0006D4DFE9|nr:uncharacterized protein LOC106684733 [Halyomorpha halys]